LISLRVYSRCLLFLVSFAIVACLNERAQGQMAAEDATLPYWNPQLPVAQRVDDLVSRMTLEEKASQVVHQAAAVPRLKIPAYNWWSESLHGVAPGLGTSDPPGIATVFPEPIGLGATFDAPLIHDMAVVIGTEARALHHDEVAHGNYMGVGLDFWAPNINIFRDPRWGRGQETYGEDPFLTARMGVAFVSGMQGDDSKYLRVISTPKHYAVHSGPEPSRHAIDVKVSKHDEEDTYLPAFRAAVIEGGAGSVMCAYNRINGEPACANTFLLGDQLRGMWNFQGYVVSDCGAVEDVQRGHHFVSTQAEAAAIVMQRGMDLECNDPGNDYSHYVEAVKQGLLKEVDLDRAVKRLMTARFKLGMFDPPADVPYAQIALIENDSAAHRELAARAARESIVLLKNDGTLPLKAGVDNIAVVGPLADQVSVLEGNYHGLPSRATTILQGIQKQFPNARVSFDPGTIFLRGGDLPIPPSVFTTNNGQPGLNAEYFAGRELQGSPVVTRVDPSINFEFTGKSPAPGLGQYNFSVRWTGFLNPAKSGTYQLGVNADDGYRLWIDGKLVVEDWTTHAPSQQVASIDLKKGHKYALKLEYFQGNGGAVAQLIWIAPQEDPLSKAVVAARKASVVIAVVGITSDLEGEESGVNQPGFKGGDRTSLDLPEPEQKLLEALKATGKPLIVVLMNGSALAVNWANQNANAILEAWYPGEEGGTAVGETLAGVNNPAGRLPVTFYRGVDQLPPFEDYSMSTRTYRYFRQHPLYPFGYGLSYSSFRYSNLKLSTSSFNAGDSLQVEADVQNTGCCDGDEVAELYVTFPDLPGVPIRALRGFTRMHLAKGETRHAHFLLNPRDLSLVNSAGDRIVASGTYRVSVGGGQPGTDAATVDGSFAISGSLNLPD
jgi:beta-glucosidase